MVNKVKEYKLPNGLKVISYHNDSNPIISMQLFIRIGSSHESYSESGFSHFTEHLVFKSTEKYPRNQIMGKASDMGAVINAYTEYDSTCHYLTVPSKFTEEGLDLLSELAFHANFNDKEFETEKRVVLEELKQCANDPEDSFVENIPDYVMEESPYCNHIIGRLDNLLASKPEDLRSFYKKYYVPENSFLVISGSFEDDKLKALIERYFGSFNNYGQEFQRIEFNKENRLKQGFQSFSIYNEELSQDLLAFVVPELNEKSEEGLALSILIRGFAMGNNSRLNKRLYLKERLVSSIQVQSISGNYDGISVILIVPRSNRDRYKICKIFKEEFDKLSHKGLTHDELHKIRTDLIHGWKYAFEYNENIASVLGMEEVDSGYKGLFEYLPRLNKITLDKINKIGKKTFVNDNLHLMHIGESKDFLRRVKKNYSEVSEDVVVKQTIDEKSDIQEYVCENGLRLIMQKKKGNPTVGITISREISPLYEPDGMKGVSFFEMALLQYGNKKYSHQELIDYCHEYGIEVNTHSSYTTSGLKMKCFSENLSRSLALMSDIIKTPVFPNDSLKNIKQNIIVDKKRIVDFPDRNAEKLFHEYMLGANSNLHNRTGNIDDIKGMTRKKIISWHKEFLDLSQMSLAVVGDINFGYVIDLVESIFNYTTEKSNITRRYLYNKPQKKLVEYDFDSDQSIISIGGFGCPRRNSKLYEAFELLSIVIGGDNDSRMFNELRERLGVAYSASFNYRAFDELGYFYNSAIVDANREQEAIDAILNIMRDIKNHNITRQELERSKNFIMGQNILTRESNSYLATTLSLIRTLGHSLDFYRDTNKRVENVSLEDIKEITDLYFNEDNLYTQIYR